MSLNYLATRFTCSWPWDTLVMLCDGRIVCGCADPYGKRVLGDARTRRCTTSGPASHRRAAAGSQRRRIEVLRRLPAQAAAQERRGAARARPLDAGRLPRRLYIECTAACNISCTQACCAPETGITRTRQAGMLDFDLFRASSTRPGRRSCASISSTTARRSCTSAPSRCASTSRRSFPHIYLYTSTNGLAFTEEQARRLVHSGIDEVTFSIDGATQESYAKYRQRGRVRRRDSQPAGDGRRKAADRAAMCRT